MAGNNQGDVQASLRTKSTKSLDSSSDWAAVFDAAGIAAGPWNGRCIAYINAHLSTSYTNLPQAQNAFAVAKGYTNWSSMSTLAGL